MVYVAPLPSALPLSDGLRKDLPRDAAYFGKENWPRTHKQSKHAATNKQQADSIVAPVTHALSAASESDAEVEQATAAAATSKPSSDDADLKSSTSVSDWCAQMVCYIWFSGIDSHEPSFSASSAVSSPTTRPGRLSVTNSPTAKRHSKKLSLGSLSEAVSFSVRDLHNAVEAHARSAVDAGSRSRPTASERSSDPRTLRLFPRRRFTDFVRNMLNTTQVSKSVIILALLYIHRLKSKNPGLRGQDGSEFRLFVTALMLANKFLDDHTYTNKTWSELSGLKLKDVTKMEIEFWLGLSSNIHASDADFRSWIGTLEILAERRHLALCAHEAEKARQTALHQHGLIHSTASKPHPSALLHPHQAPGLSAIYDAPRRIANNSRVSQSRSWSPEVAEARHRSSPSAATSHLSHMYAAAAAPAPVAALVPRFEMDAGVQAIMNHAGYLTPAASSADCASRSLHVMPNGVQQPLASVCGGAKRSYGQYDQTSPLSEPSCYQTPSPERSTKRRQLDDERAMHTFGAAARNYGLSPPFAQPYPRSVFEPLVSTPNTLLAPFVMQQPAGAAGGMTCKPHPLAYWQLAAGYDRGILGVHMPAPIACQSDYFHWQPAHDAAEVMAIRKPLATTTPYPTPPIDAFSPLYAGYASKQAMMHGYAQYAVQAPHAPFNNAEAHYVDPLLIRY
ncbi:hypothetical protein L1887_48967 [Cichorium endivia]|nr:hypothetical protein L1887_48967 [Cichorium endivia]